MSEYHLTEQSQFAIQCESCPQSTGYFDTWEKADRQAKQDGFTFIETLEDGTINFCKQCRKESDPEQSIKEYEIAACALNTEKRPWSDSDKLCIMVDVAKDGHMANYGLTCFVCKQPWLQYEYAYMPFDMEAYCHYCKSGMRQGKGLQGSIKGRAIVCSV